MSTYTFDQKLFRTVYVQASSEKEAREILAGQDQNAACDCRIIFGEESEDGEADLVEVTP
jgi:hypothetical protein